MKKLSDGGSSLDCWAESRLLPVTCEQELGRPLVTVDTELLSTILSVSVDKLLLAIGGSGEDFTRQLPDDADFERRPGSWLLIGGASIASSSLTLRRGINGTELVIYNTPQRHHVTLVQLSVLYWKSPQTFTCQCNFTPQNNIKLSIILLTEVTDNL